MEDIAAQKYYAIPCNTMQNHASLITTDGAYHCPVGSIMAIFISSGIAGFHNLWSQDFENAQCLEESQVGYTQEKKGLHTPYLSPNDQ